MGTNGQQPYARFRDCECPGTPHAEGDVAYLREFLPFLPGAEAARLIGGLMTAAAADGIGSGMTEKALEDAMNVHIAARLFEVIGPLYIREGVVGWNLVDEDGEAIECTPEALEALPYEQAYVIADKADDLYTERVLHPLALRLSASSNGMPTASTSVTRSSGPKARKRSSRSSRATSAAGPPPAP